MVEPILNEYLNGGKMQLELSAADTKVLIELAMKRRLTIERNEDLAVKLAEHYNKNQQNDLLLIQMDTFRDVCRSIDG